MNNVMHFRHGDGYACKAKPSQNVIMSTDPAGVTCIPCMRTKEFKDALKTKRPQLPMIDAPQLDPAQVLTHMVNKAMEALEQNHIPVVFTNAHNPSTGKAYKLALMSDQTARRVNEAINNG